MNVSCRAIRSSCAHFIAVQLYLFMLLGIRSFAYHVPHADLSFFVASRSGRVPLSSGMKLWLDELGSEGLEFC